jgi:Putative metal-binding motif
LEFLIWNARVEKTRGSKHTKTYRENNMMISTNYLRICLLALCALLLSAQVQAKTSYLNSVNSTCGTNYGCGLCHNDPRGGGSLNQDGQAYRASGYDATYFCPGSGCTDNDGDGFAVEGGSCGPIDCDDNNAAINPNAAEICDDLIDNDCDANADCDDNECSTALVCIVPSMPEICDDGIDNDGDNKVDCADRKDCRTDATCNGSSGPVEICFDGIDNDGDNKVDCADKKDCGKDPVCR